MFALQVFVILLLVNLLVLHVTEWDGVHCTDAASKVILLTNDINLRNKGLIMNIECYSESVSRSLSCCLLSFPYLPSQNGFTDFCEISHDNSTLRHNDIY